MSNNQNNIIESMEIPPTLYNALELAQAQIYSIVNKEKVYKKIEELIEQD